MRTVDQAIAVAIEAMCNHAGLELSEGVMGVRETLEANGYVIVPKDQTPEMVAGVAEATENRERMWCLSCGTITRDSRCDCTEYGQDSGAQNLVNYADECQKEARRMCVELDDANKALEAAAADDQLKEEVRKLKEELRALREEVAKLRNARSWGDYTRS